MSYQVMLALHATRILLLLYWLSLVRTSLQAGASPMTAPQCAVLLTFTAENGHQVCETVTESGVTGRMDTSIPMDALRGWRERLLRRTATDAQVQHVKEMAEIERLRET